MHRARSLFALLAVAALLLLAAAPEARAAADPARDRQWGLDLIRAPQAWSVGRGAGTTIAVVDTGVDLPHEDLKSKLLPGRSFSDAPLQDDQGHGTHVAGIAAAATDNGRGIAGVAPEATILPVRVLGSDGGGSYSDVADGVRFAADQRATVINLSLGPEVPLLFNALDDSLVRAIDYAWSKGSIVVIAAGNNFVPVSEYGSVKAIVVAAVTRDDRVATYSTGVGGAMWSIAAPGGASSSAEGGVLSTYWVSGKTNSYAYLAGTSMATPHVAGAAAVLRGLGLSPQQTVDRLLATAKDLGAAGKDNDYGSGRLDLAAAVAGLKPSTTGTTSGQGSATTRRTTSDSNTSPTAAPPAAPPGPDAAPVPTTPSGEAAPEGDADASGGSDDFEPIEVEDQAAGAGAEVARGAETRGDGDGLPWLAVLGAAALLAAVAGLGVRRLRRAP